MDIPFHNELTLAPVQSAVMFRNIQNKHVMGGKVEIK